MHVVALPKARRRDYLGFLWTMLLGRDPGKSRWAVRFTCTDLTLHSEGAFPVQADGDIVATCPVDFAIQARPIHFR